MHIIKGKVRKIFSKIVKKKDQYYLKMGLYEKQLKRFFELFPKENVIIIINEEMRKDKNEILNQVLDFINL